MIFCCTIASLCVSHANDDDDFDENMESSDSEMETDGDEEEWEDIDKPESSGDPTNKNKGGRPLKPFSTSGPTQRRVKLTDPYLACEKASDKHGIDFIPLLGHLAKMHINKQATYNESDKLWLELFKLVSEGINPMEKHSIGREKAVYLSENVVKGEKKWNKLRNCIGHNIIPAFNQIKLFKKEYHPDLGNQCHQL